ncbi:hypothetical protein ANANG_G00016390 [Anguilla anguilla]|uniref:Uncharacterized protein n=1 Tax=Anguilla anguilla TaxID=7936 RepID=A0A9D3N0P9_ANGAN|nr:hypothetical protein ANANG_G00016390 [Anguilla anguilla]
MQEWLREREGWEKYPKYRQLKGGGMTPPLNSHCVRAMERSSAAVRIKFTVSSMEKDFALIKENLLSTISKQSHN